MRLRNPKFLFALALTLLVGCGVYSATAYGVKNILRPNPADSPELVRQKLDKERYNGAGGCVRRDPKGMKALIRWMKRNTRKNTVYGTIRCDGGVHGTGRALDWALDARKKSKKRLAMTIANTWMADDKRGRDNALARRMGIQLIIYNCRYWQTGDAGWSRYSACNGRNPDPTQGHIDHMHIELTRKAARLKTSYWRTYGKNGGPKGSSGGGGGGGIAP